jgi:hypothetical protein
MKIVKVIKTVVLTAAALIITSTGILYAEDKPAAVTPSVTAATPAAAPAEDKVTGSAAVGMFNRYVFRGYVLSKDSLVIQPTATVSYKGVSLNLWSNIDSRQKSTNSATDVSGSFNPAPAGEKNLNETDLTLSYTYNIDKLALTGGYTYYGTDYAAETEEVFLTAAYDMLLKPSLSVYRDVNNYGGTYFNLAIAHSLNITKEITFDLGASVGYEIGSATYWNTHRAGDLAAGNTGGKYSALHDGMVKAGFTVPAGKFTIQPTVQYWFPLSSDAKKTVADSDGIKYPFNPNGALKSTVVGGLTVTLNF